MLIHCPSCLSTAASVLNAELACGDGMSAMWTAERGQAMLHFDGVISHIFKCSRIFEQGSEPKLLGRESASIKMTGQQVNSTSHSSFCAGKETAIACDSVSSYAPQVLHASLHNHMYVASLELARKNDAIAQTPRFHAFQDSLIWRWNLISGIFFLTSRTAPGVHPSRPFAMCEKIFIWSAPNSLRSAQHRRKLPDIPPLLNSRGHS